MTSSCSTSTACATCSRAGVAKALRDGPNPCTCEVLQVIDHIIPHAQYVPLDFRLQYVPCMLGTTQFAPKQFLSMDVHALISMVHFIDICSTLLANNTLHRQEAPNSMRGRKSVHQIQATIGMDIVTDEARHDSNCNSRTLYIDLFRGAYKIFIQELPMSIPEELSHKHSRRGSSRSYCNDLLGWMLTRSPQDLRTRTCTRSCKDA